MCKVEAENRLEHSSNAISVTAQFFNKQVMVYVEGPDDVPFWDAMFSRVVDQNFYEISAVNGKETLQTYIKRIEDGLIQNAFVAADLDYGRFVENGRSTSPFVIYTYGHSIENTMFCPHSVSRYLRRASKSTDDFDKDVQDWFSNLLSVTRPLLAWEVLNSIDVGCQYHPSNGSNSFLGRGFFYYQDPQGKKCVSSKTIGDELAKHNDFDTVQLSKLEQMINAEYSTREPRFICQGHYLAQAAINFIRLTLEEKYQKQSLSNDALYLSFSDCVVPCKPLCRDKQHVCFYIQRAVNEYKDRLARAS